MAFEAANFIPLSALANSNAPRQFQYRSSADNIAAVKASGYFDAAAAATGGLGLKDADIICVQATDGTSLIEVLDTAGVITTALAVDFA